MAESWRFHAKMRFLINFNDIVWIKSNIRAPVSLHLLNPSQKRDKMLGKPHILSHLLKSFRNSLVRSSI